MINEKKFLIYNTAWHRAYVLRQNILLTKPDSEKKIEKLKALSKHFQNKSMESYDLLLNPKSQNEKK